MHGELGFGGGEKKTKGEGGTFDSGTGRVARTSGNSGGGSIRLTLTLVRSVLELAVAAGAKIIAIHNLRDFRGIEKWGVAALPPSGFLQQLAQSS